MKRVVLIFALCILICGSGCAAVGTYFKDRALDFVDCFKADVGYGYGLDVRMKVTDLFCPSVGFGHTRNVGFRGRYSGTWTNIDMGFPLAGLILFLHAPDHNLKGLEFSVFNSYAIGLDKGDPYTFHAQIKGKCKVVPGGFGTASFLICPGFSFHTNRNVETMIRVHYPDSRNIINKFDLEIGGTIIAVGFQVGFSPGQFVDFILGWFGVDIGDDDTKKDLFKPGDYPWEQKEP